MPDLTCDLVAVTIEHLRGFDKAAVSLSRQNIVLVGPNNSGKTSLLRLLHWVLTEADEDLLVGRRRLTDAESLLLLPARDTRGGARRLTLSVRIPDGRRHRTYQAEDGLAFLRLQLKGDRVVALLGQPRRSEPRESDPRAVALLGAVQACHPTTFIAPSRDASSDTFGEALRAAIRGRLADRLLHQERGGAPAEYRRAARALKSIEELAEKQASGLIADLSNGLPGAMTRASRVDFDATPAALVDWLAERAGLLMSTGTHDERMVPPEELGSGLQSVLVMQLLNNAAEADSTALLLLEEPEAFLHPSAQRTLARSLFDSQNVRLVTSTHSTVVVDESTAADVVLVRGHRVFSPSDADSRRRAINSALLTGQGSEAIFARSVLLVEGPGDRAFFEVMRRRMADFMDPELLSHLGIVAVGGKTRFAPWLQLLEAYADRHSGYRPIASLVVGDSVDAAGDLTRAYRDAQLTVPADLDREARAMATAFVERDMSAGLTHTAEYNRVAENAGVGLAMLPIDLEHAILESASPQTVQRLAEVLGLVAQGRDDLMTAMGSKAHRANAKDGGKGDWMRAEVARQLPWAEVGDAVRSILRRWLSPLLDEANAPIPQQLTSARATSRSTPSRTSGDEDNAPAASTGG